MVVLVAYNDIQVWFVRDYSVGLDETKEAIRGSC